MRSVAYKSQMCVLGATLALLLGGCGKQQSGITKVVVQGTVTFDGEPISNGEIRFYPAEGTQGPVSGGPIKDGKYVAKGKGGVPVGKHTVDIRAFRPESRSAQADPEGGPVVQWLPSRFNANTTLIATISKDTDTQDFDLSSR